jgi:hypothetical protein
MPAILRALSGGVDTTILLLRIRTAARLVVMNSRAEDRVRRDLDELVDAGLDVAAFCAAAGPLVARAVPSATGVAATPTWYALDPRSL